MAATTQPRSRGARAAASSPATVVDYDPQWSEDFQALRALLEPLVADIAVAIEHVGSTAVPGLAAKPIIDVDVVVEREDTLCAAVNTLADAGWTPQGDLGVPGRQAFTARPGLPYHHLYVVISGSPPHLDHVLLRDYLRLHAEAVAEYSALKKRLAPLLTTDRQAYADGKAELIERLLSDAPTALEPRPH